MEELSKGPKSLGSTTVEPPLMATSPQIGHFSRADRQYNHSYLNLSRHRGKPATTERPNCHNRELKHGAILYNEAEVFSLSIGTLRKTQRQRQRHQTKGLMSRTMAVHVRYNSLYISLPCPVKQPILRCLKNVNYDG